jgi:hypothetical protein
MFAVALAGHICPPNGSARATFNRSRFVTLRARMRYALCAAVTLIGSVASMGLQTAAASPQAPASLTFYSDKAAFDTAAPGLTTEDFENGLPLTAEIYIGCSDPFDCETDDDCWDPGQVVLGISIQVRARY